MTPPSVSHDGPHHLAAVEFVGLGGWAIVTRVADDGCHAELRLVRGEEADELLACWHSEQPAADEDWGGSLCCMVAAMAHAAWHVATATAPNGCGDPAE